MHLVDRKIVLYEAKTKEILIKTLCINCKILSETYLGTFSY